MKRIIIVILTAALAMCVGKATAQSVSSLRINPDARSGGMAGVSVATPSTPFSIYNNMAAVSFSESQFAAGYSFTLRTSDIMKNNNLQSVAGYYRINERHSIGAGVRLFTQPKVDFYGEDGQFVDNYRPRDIAADIGYAYAITDYLSAAVNMRYVSSRPSQKDNANMFAADLSLFFTMCDWSVGLSLSNVGSKVKYSADEKYDMPAWVDLGVGRQFSFAQNHKLLLSVEGTYIFLPSKEDGMTAGFGAEYLFKDMLAFRGGYYVGENDVRGNYGTVGLGLKLCGFDFDVSYLIGKSKLPIRNTWQFGLGYRF